MTRQEPAGLPLAAPGLKHSVVWSGPSSVLPGHRVSEQTAVGQRPVVITHSELAIPTHPPPFFIGLVFVLQNLSYKLKLFFLCLSSIGRSAVIQAVSLGSFSPSFSSKTTAHHLVCTANTYWTNEFSYFWMQCIFTGGYNPSEKEKWLGSTCSSADKGNWKSRPVMGMKVQYR